MNNNDFDAIIFGNGTTINLLEQLKPYIKIEKLYLFNIDEFLNKFITNNLDPREEEKIFKIFYRKNDIKNIKYFKEIKYELSKFYLKNDANIEKILGRDILRNENDDIGYNIKSIVDLFPALYNIWFDILYEYITYIGLEKYIEAFYESIKSMLVNNNNIYTTNFDYFAENYLNPKHLHGKFVKGISKYEDVVLCKKNDNEFYFKYIWGVNGVGKISLIQQLSRINNVEEYFDFEFFCDESTEIDKLLLYGLSFQRSGYITEKFLEKYPKYKNDNLIGSVLDEHILIRIKQLQNMKRLNNIVITYYSQDEKKYFELLFEFHRINNVRIIHASELDFKIK